MTALIAELTDAALDLLLGSACAGCGNPGRALCDDCRCRLGGRAGERRPTPEPPGLPVLVSAGEYDGELRRALLAHKEHGRYALAAPLGTLLADAVRLVADREAGTVLVPVPSTGAVVRRRGHDPVLRMARAAARVLRRQGYPVAVHPLLRQARSPQDQAGLDAAARLQNLSGAFAVRASRRLPVTPGAGPLTVVCDDILTTGATAAEAVRALAEAGLRARAVATVASTRRRLPDLR